MKNGKGSDMGRGRMERVRHRWRKNDKGSDLGG